MSEFRNPVVIGLEAAMQFAYAHAADGARELLESQNTSVLPAGRVRELANTLLWLPAAARLRFAERAFEKAALLRAAGLGLEASPLVI